MTNNKCESRRKGHTRRQDTLWRVRLSVNYSALLAVYSPIYATVHLKCAARCKGRRQRWQQERGLGTQKLTRLPCPKEPPSASLASLLPHRLNGLQQKRVGDTEIAFRLRDWPSDLPFLHAALECAHPQPRHIVSDIVFFIVTFSSSVGHLSRREPCTSLLDFDFLICFSFVYTPLPSSACPTYPHARAKEHKVNKHLHFSKYLSKLSGVEVRDPHQFHASLCSSLGLFF